MKMKILGAFFALFLLTTFGCHDTEQPEPIAPYLKYKTVDYSGKNANEWMQLGYDMIKANFLFGPHAARTYGYLGLTVWESVYNGIPGARSMAGQINDFPAAASLDTEKSYDWGIVLCTAMKTVLPELVDNTTPSQRGQIQVLADLQESQMMAKGVSAEVQENSRDLGVRTGLNIVARIKRDGRDVIRNLVTVIPQRTSTTKQYWDPTTYNQKPVEPNWSTIRTFVIDNSQSCESAAPYSYSEDPASAFYKDAKEVYDFYPLNDNNKRIAFHWDNGPGRTCSPACHWVNIALQLLQNQNANLALSAKAFCKVGFAAADGFSQAWYMKYKHFILRPTTYIREVLDPKWEAGLGMPPYPDYTSGSSTMGGAAPAVLVPIFGDVPFTDRTHLGSPLYTPDGGPWILPERQFTGLIQAGEEQAESRILGGVHFRLACSEGLKSGRCVGNTINARIDFGY